MAMQTFCLSFGFMVLTDKHLVRWLPLICRCCVSVHYLQNIICQKFVWPNCVLQINHWTSGILWLMIIGSLNATVFPLWWFAVACIWECHCGICCVTVIGSERFEGTTILRNVRNWLHVMAVSCPRRMESSNTLLWKPQNFHKLYICTYCSAFVLLFSHWPTTTVRV